MRKQILAVVFGAFVLGGCAFTPHTVALNSNLQHSKSTVGSGTTVVLELVDDRESDVVGQRGAGMQGADITVSGLLPHIDREIKEGLQAKGFTVVSNKKQLGAAPADLAEMEVRLRAFKFFIETGFWTGAENSNVAINVEAEKNGDDFKRAYRASAEDRTMVIPGGSTIDEQMNARLSSVIDQLIKDEELMAFLAAN